jgi:DNA-binding CsgD family transcriptional regulator/tetratricopeptide (TPR) repeat protein
VDEGAREVPPGALAGRSGDLAVLGDLLERAAADGAALLLTGEPGVGRTALLAAAARDAAAAGTRVLTSAAVDSEAEVPFAGLHQLLLPVLEEASALSALHREALGHALGYRAGPAADRLVVSTAVLSLLRVTATADPVLVVVDDLQALDPASAAVLGFVARRLPGSRVGVLAAWRSAGPAAGGPVPPAGLPVHEVHPLAAGPAEELLAARWPATAPGVRRRVLAAACGNPLALVELPAALTARQRTALDALPGTLPLGPRLQAVFGAGVGDLPPPTRRLLLLAALTDPALPEPADPGVLAAACPGEDWLDVLAPAERAGLLRVDADARRVRLRHPLVGAAAVALATSAERRRAHLTLAEALPDQPDRRAWHLAEAAAGSDGRAADLLDEAAHRALRSGDAVRAVTALLRAADLSPGGPDRARRLARAAAVGAEVTGELRGVPSLLLQARRADPDGGDSLPTAVAAASHLLLADGDVDGASRLLARALGSAPAGPGGAGELDDALHGLVQVCAAAGRWQLLDAAAARLGDRADPLVALSRAALGAPPDATAADLRRLDELVAGVDGDADPARVVRIARAAAALDRLADCRQALERVARDGREGGAVAAAVHALVLLARDAHAAGRWEEARRTAEEALGLAEPLGYRLPAVQALGRLALLSAAEGDAATARDLADRVAAWAGPRGVRAAEHLAARARALAALAQGDVEEAHRQAAAAGPAGAPGTGLDLVEAAVRTGRRAEAAAHAAALQALPTTPLRPRLALLAAGSAGLAAPDDRATAHFEAALAVPGADRAPFELARVRLAFGEHLRRVRATGAARLHLAAALDAFTRLGARPWAARAETELRATGVSRSPAGPAAAAVLTPQEHEISQLAASGLTNKQIGAQLYLSPRTVSAHLYRVFPKLGISSRAALRDALARVPEDAGAARRPAVTAGSVPPRPRQSHDGCDTGVRQATVGADTTATRAPGPG